MNTGNGWIHSELVKSVLIALFFLCGVLPAGLFVAGDGSLPEFLLREDGLYESVAGLACFGGGIAAFIAFKYSGRNLLDKNMWLLCFGLVLFGLAGEEVSWGQRILGLSVPSEVLELNFQHELNLHNAKFVQTGNNQLSDLLTRLLLAYLILFPLGLNVFPSLNRLFRKIRFPVPSLLTVIIAISLKVANSICYRVVYGSNYEYDRFHIGEAFESLLELCLVCVAVELLLGEITRRKQSSVADVVTDAH